LNNIFKDIRDFTLHFIAHFDILILKNLNKKLYLFVLIEYFTRKTNHHAKKN